MLAATFPLGINISFCKEDQQKDKKDGDKAEKLHVKCNTEFTKNILRTWLRLTLSFAFHCSFLKPHISMDRRIFLKGALASGALALTGLDLKLARASRFMPASPYDAALTKPSQTEQSLADQLINYARSIGATYCDIRLVRYLSQSVSARDNVVTGISDWESYGIGIRVIKDGTWGFTATRNVNETSGKRAVDEAVAHGFGKFETPN